MPMQLLLGYFIFLLGSIVHLIYMVENLPVCEYLKLNFNEHVIVFLQI